MSTLSFDGSAFTEYLNNGYQLKYKSQGGSGAIATHPLINVSDPSGNTHTYTYGTGEEAGLLKSIQVPGGNLVTFTYAASSPTSLLNSVVDVNRLEEWTHSAGLSSARSARLYPRRPRQS